MEQLKRALKELLQRQMQEAMSDHTGVVIWTGMRQHVEEIQAIDRLERFATGFVRGDLPQVRFNLNRYSGRALLKSVTLNLNDPVLSRCKVEVELPGRQLHAVMSVVDLVALLELGPM